MKKTLHLGDIIKIERIQSPVLVTSKDFFYQTGEIIGGDSPLHIRIKADYTEGYVQCEKLALLDLNVRGFLKTDSVSMEDIIDITDAIQGIFDYI